MTTRNNNRHSRRQQSCLFEALEHRQMYTAAGQLDTSFNATGMATLDSVNGYSPNATCCAVQSDGKVVVAGSYTSHGNVYRSHILVARFAADGALDSTFGEHMQYGFGRKGWAATDFSSGNSAANAVAIQPDGKIILAGSSESGMAIVRFNSNGTLDTSFDGDGKRTVSFGDQSWANSLALQQDGRIVIAGGEEHKNWLGNYVHDAVMARLNPSGSLDNSFDHDGKKSYGFGWDEAGKVVAIDYTGTAATNSNFGKIYLAGNQYAESYHQHFVTRVNTNGSIDQSFNQANGFAGQGATMFRFSTAPSALNGMLIQRDGKVVLTGVTGDPSVHGAQQFAITRLGTDGWFDQSFNGGQTVMTGFGGDDIGQAVVQSATGNLVVAGTVNNKLALASYTKDGKLNTRFGTGGRVQLDFGAGRAGVAALAQTSDHKLVIAGGQHFMTARLGDDALHVRPVGGNIGQLMPALTRTLFSEARIDQLVA